MFQCLDNTRRKGQQVRVYKVLIKNIIHMFHGSVQNSYKKRLCIQLTKQEQKLHISSRIEDNVSGESRETADASFVRQRHKRLFVVVVYQWRPPNIMNRKRKIFRSSLSQSPFSSIFNFGTGCVFTT